MRRARRMMYALAALWVACQPSPSNVLEELEGDTASSICYSVAGLKNLYVDGSHRVAQVAYIEASITANDMFGEYGSTLVVEDDSGGVEISVDLEDDLYLYRIGARLKLLCTDLWMGSYGGTIVLGAEPTADDVVDALSLDDLERVLLGLSYDHDIREAQPLTLSQLSPQYISCFVELEGLQFVDDGVTDSFCAYDADLGRRLSTTHTLCDDAGDEISLYVRSTATYASEKLPTGSVKIYATLSSYGGNYSVTLVERQIYPME